MSLIRMVPYGEDVCIYIYNYVCMSFCPFLKYGPSVHHADGSSHQGGDPKKEGDPLRALSRDPGVSGSLSDCTDMAAQRILK